MKEEIADEIIKWYSYLEEQVIEFIHYIRPSKKNLKICSFRFAIIIIEACGLLDSVFRHISPKKIDIDGKLKDIEGSGTGIEDFAKLYANKLNLASTKSIFLISPPEYRIPFENWKNFVKDGKYKDLSWWNAHNKLKHHRLKYMDEKATLNNAVDALCGTIQVIANLPEMALATLRHGLMKIRRNPETILENLDKYNKRLFYDGWVETQLFAIYMGTRPLPVDINDFRPIQYAGTERLVSFFGKY